MFHVRASGLSTQPPPLIKARCTLCVCSLPSHSLWSSSSPGPKADRTHDHSVICALGVCVATNRDLRARHPPTHSPSEPHTPGLDPQNNGAPAAGSRCGWGCGHPRAHGKSTALFCVERPISPTTKALSHSQHPPCLFVCAGAYERGPCIPHHVVCS